MKNKVARIFLAALLTTSMVVPGTVSVLAEATEEAEEAVLLEEELPKELPK